MTYIPGLVPGPIRTPAEYIAPPLHNGSPYFEVKYHRSEGRATPEPPEDPDALPDRVAKVSPLMARQLIDGAYGATCGPFTHSRVVDGASDQYAKRMAHNRAVAEYLGEKVDIGEPCEDTAYCYTGDGECHVYKRHPFNDEWELDRMTKGVDR